LLSAQDLSGKRVLVTAGPTREAIDPFRFLSNYSTGRMGYAIAEAAARRGAEAVLLSGPSQLSCPWGVKRIFVETAAQMRQQVMDRFADAEIVVMAAAVSDWQSASFSRHKLKKGSLQELTLKLVPTPDILSELGQKKQKQFLVGFAAETENLEEYAREKLLSKGADMIVANPIGGQEAGFASENNQVTIISPVGSDVWPNLSKKQVAWRLWSRIIQELKERKLL
jgi:phosphopantothenoylcysteine decarboxylase/phosphopantothenate--cysteine ligase